MGDVAREGELPKEPDERRVDVTGAPRAFEPKPGEQIQQVHQVPDVLGEARAIHESINTWVERADLKASVMVALLAAAVTAEVVVSPDVLAWGCKQDGTACTDYQQTSWNPIGAGWQFSQAQYFGETNDRQSDLMGISGTPEVFGNAEYKFRRTDGTTSWTDSTLSYCEHYLDVYNGWTDCYHPWSSRYYLVNRQTNRFNEYTDPTH